MPKSIATKTFTENTYISSQNIPRYLGDRIFLGSRWWFYFRFGLEMLLASRLAKQDKYHEKEWLNTSFRIFDHIEGCGGRFHIEGLENLAKVDEPMVVVGNHMSTLETMALPCILSPYKSINFVVKEKLTRGLIFGPVMRSRDPVLVGRTNPRDDFRVVMSKGKEILERGQSLVIFPQSTRTPKFIPTKFNTLGVKLAKKTGAKVVPVALKTDFWSDSKWLKGFGPIYREKTIYMAFGEPISITGTGKNEHQQIIDFIQRHLKIWDSQPPQE
jgi:1-acyl-sn-glycerol-3-phosphate acyltransferase